MAIVRINPCKTISQMSSQRSESSSSKATVSEDILSVIQSGQVKSSSTSNKLSLLM